MSSVYVLQHLPIEPPGLIARAFHQRGRHLHYCRPDTPPYPPENLDKCAALVVMGGPMGAYEQDAHPWMAPEIALIRRAMDSGLPVLGICLGAQLMAAALGAKVYKGQAGLEVGWCPITLAPEAHNDPLFRHLGECSNGPGVFQWHGDTFDLPPQATLLASSQKYPHQAFRYKNSYGLQFHLEADEKIITRWLREDPHYPAQAGTSAELIRSQIHPFPQQVHQMGEALFGAFVEMIG
ncbi:MAG: gamma-glutamyl-gamma-aminobutyrate hydrolase family protein [Deltaproteobacteria bacterium]|nr:gamma-glutamyl-gamma-aminobutyrate hydrolase family protein [Deltaproteobacteria bacterium]